MKLSALFSDFFESEKTGSLVLIFCTGLSLIIANSDFQIPYTAFWHLSIGGHGLGHWINDGLMAIFFLLIGLELEREVYLGELSSFKNALWPIIAALGGMVVPALIYLFFNYGTGAQSGAGIPMATDIAFAIGVLSLLGRSVPLSLKLFLTALAVMDDLGAIIIIALFYSNGISLLYLGLALGILGVLFILNRLKIYVLMPYLIGGVAMWYCMLHSGVHATISGVMLAFVIPFGDGSPSSISSKLQHWLHRPVAFFILPVFALANTCITIPADWLNGISSTNSLGILAGLVIGKPLGIYLFSIVAVGIGVCTLPKDLQWKHVIGAGMLAGIGFTMSIFITLLAFEDSSLINSSKIAILVSSFAAGVIGFIWLRFTLKNTVTPEN